MSSAKPSTAKTRSTVAARRPWTLQSRVIVCVLASATAFSALAIVVRLGRQEEAPSGGVASILEECRQACAAMGLISTGNIERDAEEYLEAVESRELSSPLQVLVSDPEFVRAPTQDHELLGKAVSDFRLPDSGDRSVSLAELNRRGPVVLVFYYGYNCAHCVAQLIALERDLALFRELGAEVVAVSADSPAETRSRFDEFGSFSFPVLSDSDYAVSQKWGVYSPPGEDRHEDIMHGTFVVNRSGTVLFANRGYQPFLDNRSLLCWLAHGQDSAGESDATGSPSVSTED